MMLLFLSLLVSCPSFAQPFFQSQDQVLAFKSQDSLKITLPVASVTYVVIPDAKVLKIKDHSRSSGLFIVEKIEGGWHVKSSSFDTQPETWLNTTKGPQVKLEVSGPPPQLSFFLREGQIQLNHFKGDLYGYVQKGSLSLKSSQGSVHWVQQKGEINIQDYQGRGEFDSQSASVKVKDFKGDFDLKNFAGESALESIQGRVALVLTQGSHRLIKGGGSLQLDIGRSSVQVLEFLGRIEGLGEEGSLLIKVTGDPNIGIKTMATRTTLQVPTDSGAQVQLVTQDGELFPPNYLGLSKEGPNRAVRGRLRGSAGRGHISVRTQEGSVTLR